MRSTELIAANHNALRMRGAQGGQAIIELIAGLIMFSLLLVVITSMSAYLYLEHAVVTATREGARLAALSTDLAGDDIAGATDAVRTRVQQAMLAASGQAIPDEAITVIPPDVSATTGQRTVEVQVNFSVDTPFNPGGILSGFNAASTPLTVPLFGRAIMRYEE